MTRIGLRIDVDTYRGTRDGVPRLCRILDEHGTRGSFFFSVGPDNMGRHLWRLARPAFLLKMLRTRAVSLYGWDIVLRGTFWPGAVIGRRLAPTLRAAAAAGHEIGLHAWDHHAWQARIGHVAAPWVRAELARGVDALTASAGRPPTCSAAPAWKCDDTVLREKARLPFAFNSDCVGTSVFRPVVDGKVLAQPQVPATLPTYDEAIGRGGVTAANYNEYILGLVRADALNVLTIHAEAEGIVAASLFDRFLAAAAAQGIAVVPLGCLVAEAGEPPPGRLVPGHVPGREGWLARQAPADGVQS